MVTKLTLEYDGGDFAGWARQPGERSVQEELETAIATILREPLTLSVAGRTDRGVHAWAQVASYAHEALDPTRVNWLLPDDIAVLASEPMAADFDARRSAQTRTYCYRILARRERSALEHRRAMWVPGGVDREALDACAALLRGKHDFTAFTPSGTGHSSFEREVFAARWKQRGALLEFWIEAESFLRQMNRVLIGTMLDVAAARLSIAGFERLLGGRPRSEAGPTAPAHALHLAEVSYAPIS